MRGDYRVALPRPFLELRTTIEQHYTIYEP